MHCAALHCDTKPQDTLVWAFSLIKSRWPTACAWHADGEIWASLARAYRRDGFSVATDCTPELRAQPVADIKVWVEGGHLQVCAADALLAVLTRLPQWRHRLAPSARVPDITDTPTVSAGAAVGVAQADHV